MKHTQLRVKEDTMKWHIKHYARQGYTVKSIHMSERTLGKIKSAVVVSPDGEETITISPKAKMRRKVVAYSYGVHKCSPRDTVQEGEMGGREQEEPDIPGTAESSEVQKRSGEIK